MAGTLTISTLSDGTNSTSATNCIQGSAKAWANINGSNGSIRASFNVSSVTRTAIGIYQIYFSNAFADTNYIVCGSGDDNASTTGVLRQANSNKTTTSCTVNTCLPGNTSGDAINVSVAFFR